MPSPLTVSVIEVLHSSMLKGSTRQYHTFRGECVATARWDLHTLHPAPVHYSCSISDLLPTRLQIQWAWLSNLGIHGIYLYITRIEKKKETTSCMFQNFSIFQTLLFPQLLLRTLIQHKYANLELIPTMLGVWNSTP